MPETGWFYRSFTNSFTFCLIWLACAARVDFFGFLGCLRIPRLRKKLLN